MTRPFAHVEILGPRASLDAWLALLQTQGTCHLVDALQGLEGESGISRPLPSAAQREGMTRRSEAAHRLRAVERILPGSREGEDLAARPAFNVEWGGQGQTDLEALCASAGAVAGRLQDALEAGRKADGERQQAEAVRLAVEAGRARGWEAGKDAAFAWPREASGVKRLERRLGRLADGVARAEGDRQLVLVVRGDDEALREARDLAHAAGGRDVVWPDAAAADPARALDDVRRAEEAAREADRDAITALRAVIREDGPEARALLDALEDAEARDALHRRLASTAHVAASRAYVRREDLPRLERALDVAFGGEVVVRRLAGGVDEPTLPRAVAGLPLTALAGLRPATYGSVSAAALLALAVPVALGLALADVGAGLLMLLVGGLLGIGAGPGSPRRDTSLLAQMGGVVALVAGLLVGRVFGAIGDELLGSAWGLAPALAPHLAGGGPRTVFLGVLGAAALICAFGGLVAALVHLGGHRPARAREALLGTLHHLVVAAGAGAWALRGPSGPSPVLWLGVASFVVVLLLTGRRGAGRLLLDLVGVARLVAVAFLALFAWQGATEALAAGAGVAAWILGAAVVLVTLLAALIDPAHVAMGVPYDLSLGGDVLGQPFTPLARRVVRGRSLEGGARRG